MDSRSPWSQAHTVAGFAQSPPNETLIAYARSEIERLDRRALAIDVGCGAGRNAVPLALAGWDVLAVDLSGPMLTSASSRRDQPLLGRMHLAQAAMDALPARDRSADLVIAHGIWNLARSTGEFRRAVAEAARVSSKGAALFVFTFSRNTLPATARPVEEPFVFTDFSGEPQCFLTEEELLAELAAQGFVVDTRAPLREHNLPQAGVLRTVRTPVIFEAAFRHDP